MQERCRHQVRDAGVAGTEDARSEPGAVGAVGDGARGYGWRRRRPIGEPTTAVLCAQDRESAGQWGNDLTIPPQEHERPPLSCGLLDVINTCDSVGYKHASFPGILCTILQILLDKLRVECNIYIRNWGHRCTLAGILYVPLAGRGRGDTSRLRGTCLTGCQARSA